MQKKAFVVANPVSGSGKIKQKIYSVIKELSAVGYLVTVYPTRARGDATKMVSELDDSYSLVVCCGGDGTLNEVITGLMANKNKYKLGYIPSGTLNEWSSGLKISKNIEKAAADLAAEKTIPLDIGLFDNRYFSYTASFGAFTEASYATPQGVKNVLGHAAYVLEGIKSVGKIKSIELKLIVDGVEHSGKYLFGSISNSMSVGGVVHFKETMVQLNDGMFEILLIKTPANVIEFNKILDSIIRRKLDCKSVELLHGKTVEVIGGDNINWTLDGEKAEGKDYIKVENLHNALQFIVPEKCKLGD